MENETLDVKDHVSLKNKCEKHGLRGHVQIFRENKETGKKTLWYEDDNIIPISGYQWILMKMFGLYLDSNHGKSYENLSQDTTLEIPDLNNSAAYKLGVDPNNYTPMDSDISENHFIQGFMIGNGGSGEDAITTKNTDYSFTKLRNPIPFQQTQGSLDPSISGKYLGILRVGESSFSKSYYIKKFDDRPHIYHSWWRDGQKWDYVDPVTQNDLGPDAINGAGKTDRIETYAQVEMSIDTDNQDCLSYFSHAGSTQTAMINELGLVAFDTVNGERSTIEKLYNASIKKFIKIVFDNNRNKDTADKELMDLANDISRIMSNVSQYEQPNINEFIDTVNFVINSDIIDYEAIQNELSKESNINVTAFYNQNGVFIYALDKFSDYICSTEFSGLSADEAQRIKLITYYTFNAIPLQKNWKILINYRIYAN